MLIICAAAGLAIGQRRSRRRGFLDLHGTPCYVIHGRDPDTYGLPASTLTIAGTT